MSRESNYYDSLRDRFDMRSRIRMKDGSSEEYSIRQNKGYWVSQNGRKLFPNEFDYTHLINTIKKIERKAYEAYIWPEEFRIYRLLREELRLRIENNENLD